MLFFIFAPILITIISAFVILVSPWWSLKEGKNRIKFVIFLIGSLLISSGASYGIYVNANRSMMYNEVWHFAVKKIIHEEEWTTREMYTVQVPSGTVKGVTTYRTEIRYRTQRHGPFWKVQLDDGHICKIGSSSYNHWKNIWKNETNVGEHKGSSANFAKAITGQIYACKWNDQFNTMFPWSEIHKYTNKVRRSKSVLKYKTPTKELIKQYPRPADNNNVSSIISYGVPISAEDVLFMDRINAKLGRRYEIHIILMIFKNKDKSIVDDVMSAWQGTNKNELVIFMNVNDNKITWAKVESWMDNTKYHGMIADQIIDKPINIKKLGEYILASVGKNWHRKEFKDFEYLAVKFPWYFYAFNIIAITVLSIINGLLTQHIIEKINRY